MAIQFITIHMGREGPDRAEADFRRVLGVHCSECLGCGDFIYPAGSTCPACPTDSEAQATHGEPFAYSLDGSYPQNVREARTGAIPVAPTGRWTHHDQDGNTHHAHLDADGGVVLEGWD